MSLLHKVKEIKETKDYNEVNVLIKENWILLNIASNNQALNFSLGRISD